jgi:hypothetical protein
MLDCFRKACVPSLNSQNILKEGGAEETRTCLIANLLRDGSSPDGEDAAMRLRALLRLEPGPRLRGHAPYLPKRLLQCFLLNFFMPLEKLCRRGASFGNERSALVNQLPCFAQKS